METSEGDPVPIQALLQAGGTSFAQSIHNNTGLYLFLGLILCSVFLAVAVSVVASAIKNFSPKDNNYPDESMPHKLLAYFQHRSHILHSTALLGHILLLTGLLASIIFYLFPIFPPYQTAVIFTAPAMVLLLYFALMLLAQKIASKFGTQEMAATLVVPIYGLSKILLPIQKPFSQLLEYADATLENESEAAPKYATLRDILGQNNEAPNAAEEKKILRGILNFSNIYVKQIMRPRTEVVAHDITTSFPRLRRLINENRYSRVPIYDGSFDSIAGILYIKDLLPYLSGDNNFQWQSLLREPYFVPETQKIDLLLQEFKRKKVHLAVVVDEYGGTSGIITLEDILEEIVGDIHDEFDEEEVNYSKLDKDNFIFEGKTPLIDVIRIMDLDSDVFDEARGEAETLAGLLIEISGTIPAAGDKIQYQHFCFTVETADGRRVRRVKISRQQSETIQIEQ